MIITLKTTMHKYTKNFSNFAPLFTMLCLPGARAHAMYNEQEDIEI